MLKKQRRININEDPLSIYIYINPSHRGRFPKKYTIHKDKIQQIVRKEEALEVAAVADK